MASWEDFARSEPDFAGLVQARFNSHKHKMLATLRKDGSPRLSGIEVTFADGQLWLGMMVGSKKALDLQRDPRLALHTAPLDTQMAAGDARISGGAIEHGDKAKASFSDTLEQNSEQAPEGDFHLFSVDIAEAMLVRVAGDPPDHLVIESWREEQSLKRVERR